MNRKTRKVRTLLDSSAHRHFQGTASIKQGLFCRHRRPRRWLRVLQAPRALPATLALPAAVFLLASCDPPASQLPASPPPAAGEVRRISGLPNMAEIERRLNDQYAESAESTDGVEFDPPRTSGTTVSAAIKYAEGKLLPMTIGGTEHRIKTITITRDVDGKTIPTTVEYKDKDDTTRKTVTSRYVPPPNAAANNARQSLEGGRTLHISGEEKDGAGNILRRFTATEEIQEGKTILRTTYRREGLTETVTTENGVLTQKVETYSAGATPAKGETKTKTITYEKSESAMFYPDRQKFTLAVYEDAEGKETKSDKPGDGDSIITTMPDGSTITTTFPKKKVTLAVHKNPSGTETQRIETKSDKSTITTTPTSESGTLAVHKDPDGTETQRIETKSDKSSITTTPTSEGGTLAVHKNSSGIVTKYVETTRTREGGTRAVHENPDGTVTKSVETRSDGSTITTEGGTKELVIHSSVTMIGDNAFFGIKLTSVEIPPSVSAIGKNAFRSNALTSLTIGNGVRTIGEGAFEKNRLTSVSIPPSVSAIGKNAFRNNQLTSVTIPLSVTAIEGGAFRENNLTSVSIPPLVTAIGDWAFSSNKLTSVSIPPSVTAIGDWAFYNNQLTSLTIGNGVKTIGDNAFYKNKLTSLTIGNSVRTIGEAAFSNNQLTSVSIPPLVSAIGKNAFENNQLTSLTIGNGVRTIGDYAFQNNKLTSVTIPPSVTAIGDYAFWYNKLTSVTLSKALYEAHRNAFIINSDGLKFYEYSASAPDSRGRELGTH